jgi:HJR/Mrr/RecB family endonuclease
MGKSMSRPSLMNLTVEYFTRRGYEVKKQKDGDEPLSDDGFDMIVSRHKEIHPVRVKEWNRTVGVNIVINMDQSAKNPAFSAPILVAEKFSEHAKAYANRRGLILLTRFEMIRSLR